MLHCYWLHNCSYVAVAANKKVIDDTLPAFYLHKAGRGGKKFRAAIFDGSSTLGTVPSLTPSAMIKMVMMILATLTMAKMTLKKVTTISMLMAEMTVTRMIAHTNIARVLIEHNWDQGLCGPSKQVTLSADSWNAHDCCFRNAYSPAGEPHPKQSIQVGTVATIVALILHGAHAGNCDELEVTVVDHVKQQDSNVHC